MREKDVFFDGQGVPREHPICLRTATEFIASILDTDAVKPTAMHTTDIGFSRRNYKNVCETHLWETMWCSQGTPF